MTKKPLYKIVDYLFHLSYPITPKYLKDRPMLRAGLMGFAGMTAVTFGLQEFSEKVFDPYIWDGFDTQVLPYVEEVCENALALAFVGYAALKPKAFENIVTNHPTYISGMVCAAIGAIQQAEGIEGIIFSLT